MKKINDVYTRTSRPIKVIQFGEGNFLRAFTDWMIHETNQASDFNGGIAVVQPLASGLCQMLEDQDCLYTHYMNGMVDGQAKSIHYINDAIERTINPYESYEDYLALADLDTANIIISNTTEAGISFEPDDRLEGGCQNSFPAKLTALMYRRFTSVGGSADGGYLVIPCELIDYNGSKLKDIVLKYADLWQLGSDFMEWINTANTFCNTLCALLCIPTTQ